MKILVTGGGGFLGQALVRQLLARGDTVRILTRSAQPALAATGVQCLRGDIADATVTRTACEGQDAVFHTAAKAGVWGREEAFYSTNVTGTQNILDACAAARVPFLIHTSTPSVVYNGRPLAGVDETRPLTRACPCPYPLTKAEAERRVLAANGSTLRTVALRPHLIWGAGDPHLVPRVVQQARAGRLRIIGDGLNRVDLTHVANAAHAHLLALDALQRPNAAAAGRAYFISDGAPVTLWAWINALLERLGIPPVTRRTTLGVARGIGAVAELLWRVLPLHGEPPLTRFVAVELAEDHWFDINAARQDLGYAPVADNAAALDALVAELRISRPKT
ncbi:MAG: NAD-dependent epimerase/dehydratase family protein [Puniceicoccales bacterium]|jgi:nucleoside-diphosphate-sugar epimerase|nr:NAD-dependent epimerase/dehydratase family protein [Puniceicoccales bacterium]